ncbi:MAG: TetR/AcrR family transcriptional regulator [Candidatus Dormiibacterota bacterium]
MPRLGPEARTERRQRLLEAAWRCAARRGFRDITIDDVCLEAGVSKGAFYLYFATKQDLLMGLLDDDAAEVERQIDELEQRAMPQAERVRRFTRWMLERGPDSARAQVGADLWTAALTDDALRDRFSQVIARRRSHLRSWIAAGVLDGELVDTPANALASVLLALEDGLLLHAAVDPTAFRWERVRRALNAILNGLQVS